MNQLYYDRTYTCFLYNGPLVLTAQDAIASRRIKYNARTRTVSHFLFRAFDETQSHYTGKRNVTIGFQKTRVCAFFHKLLRDMVVSSAPSQRVMAEYMYDVGN